MANAASAAAAATRLAAHAKVLVGRQHCLRQGDPSTAATSFRDAVATWERLEGEGSSRDDDGTAHVDDVGSGVIQRDDLRGGELARSRHQLVCQLEYMGWWHESAADVIPPLLKQVSAQVSTGRFDPLVVVSLQWAAQIWWRAGDYPRATSALQSALALHAAAYGEETHHPSLLRTLLLLGMVHLSDTHYALALRNLNRAVSTAHQVYGANSCHVHYGMTLLWIGGLFAEQGDFEGAHGQLTRATAMLKACLTPCKDVSAVVSDRTSSVLAAQGDFAGAQEAALGALQTKKRLYGSIPSPPKEKRSTTLAAGEHYEIAASLYWLGVCCRLQGDTASALHHLGEALALQYVTTLYPPLIHFVFC